MTAMHKFATGTVLADAGLPVPNAILSLSGETLNARRVKFGDEVVYKTAIGTHGGRTWKLDTDDPVNPMVGSRQAFLQELLGGDTEHHRDLRVYVVDNTVVGAMTRYAPEGEWRTNVALGGEIEDATNTLPDELASLAKQATTEVGLDYAGVDIIQDSDRYYILEVNPTAGFRGLYRATGRSPAPYIAGLAITRGGGTVDEDKLRELAATFDDSRPRATPQKKEAGPGEPLVIGYIEEVVVMETTGQQSVLAKSDTGATRTSIDSRLAAQIGTGPIKDIVQVKSGSTKSGRSRPVVDVVIGIGGRQHTVMASVEDRSHMQYPLLLGRDILKHYHVDVRKQVDDDGSMPADEHRPSLEE